MRSALNKPNRQTLCTLCTNVPKSMNQTNQIRRLLKLAPDIFGKYPVAFAYLYGSYATGQAHRFSDLDIAIYLEQMPRRRKLRLELSLALEIDEKLGPEVSSEVRTINGLPLIVTANIITEGILLYSKNETLRVDFETSVRSAYFDFLPVIHAYQRAFVETVAP